MNRLIPLILAASLAAAPARAEDSLADLVEAVAPAVVNIHTTGTVSQDWGFFGSPFGRRRWTSLGSGFVVDADGLIITNHHVVRAASTIRVGLMDGRTFDAAVVGVDPDTDLALLSVDAKDLPAVTLGEEPRVGESVFAVGNPYGYDHTVTAGIISARHRDLGIGPYDDLLQTDASINPGNSGGPLFDMEGRLVGVNTAIHASGEGLGFAVPVPMLDAVLPHLRQGGAVSRGWTGLRATDGEEALVVDRVYPKGPAEEAGLQPGDVLTAVGDRPVHDAQSWNRALGSAFPGDEVRVTASRDGRDVSVNLSVVDHDEWSASWAGPPLEIPTLGIAVRPPAPDRLADTGLDQEVGLEVVQVSDDRSFFREGDILIEINGNVLRDPMDLPPVADQVMAKRKMTAVVLRGGQMSRLFYRW